jgi:hypothetical protein
MMNGGRMKIVTTKESGEFGERKYVVGFIGEKKCQLVKVLKDRQTKAGDNKYTLIWETVDGETIFDDIIDSEKNLLAYKCSRALMLIQDIEDGTFMSWGSIGELLDSFVGKWAWLSLSARDAEDHSRVDAAGSECYRSVDEETKGEANIFDSKTPHLEIEDIPVTSEAVKVDESEYPF